LDDLGCSGSESTLYTCSHSGTLYVHNCGHSEDASAVCQNNGDIRLVGSSSSSKTTVM
jgi:hypothetical protein